jgi:hypothetical protein
LRWFFCELAANAMRVDAALTLLMLGQIGSIRRIGHRFNRKLALI